MNEDTLLDTESLSTMKNISCPKLWLEYWRQMEGLVLKNVVILVKYWIGWNMRSRESMLGSMAKVFCWTTFNPDYYSVFFIQDVFRKFFRDRRMQKLALQISSNTRLNFAAQPQAEKSRNHHKICPWSTAKNKS